MREDWGADFAAILDEIRAKPVHMYRLQERMEALRSTLPPSRREALETGGEGRPYLLAEDEFFEPEEDIVVYLDFLCPEIFPTSRPLEERRALCREIEHEHVHEFFELAYVHSGDCYGYCDGEEYRLTSGTLWIFNTSVPHNVVLPDARVNLINILVRKSSFERTMLGLMSDNDLFLNFFLHSIHDAQVRPQHMRVEVEPGGALEEYVYHIVREYHRREPYFQSVMRMQFCCMLAELARRSRASARPSIPSAREGALDPIQLIAYISDHSATITLSQAAEHFHYTTNYLSKFIRRHTGKSFSELILSFRMTQAAHCLSHTDLTLEQIAALTGYTERSNFDKAFERYWGQTPAQFQRDKTMNSPGIR